MSKVSVTLNVAGIPIKIKVSSQDEGYIRNGAKSLNNIVADYTKIGPEKEYGYYLALAALQSAAQVEKLSKELNLLKECDERLEKLLEP
ncbi:MAG: cell division protein ZapA [Bacteroidales bacterium]|nr:cell division protein ZapA [Bacteroidales bacterium]